MAKKVFWLNAKLFGNTKTFMNMGHDELSKYIQRNCSSEIRRKIKELRSLMSEHCARRAQAPQVFLDAWNPIQGKIWAPDVVDALDKLIDVFEDVPDIVVGEEYIDYLDKFARELQIKTRFAISSIKLMDRTGAINDPFNEKHDEIFIQYAMMPHFSAPENSVKLRHYLTWLKDIDNLLKASDDKGEKLFYYPEQISALQKPVDQYIEFNGYEYNKADFYSMMKGLFQHLRSISTRDEREYRDGISQEILEKVKETYRRHVFPNVSIRKPVHTLGFSEIELDILVGGAAEDTLTAYWSYWERFDKDKKPSWEDCIIHSGFYTEMLYFLYSRLWHQDSDFLKAVAQNIRNKCATEYRTFISEEADIAPTVFIEEDCNIGDAVVKDNVFLSHCEISDGVVIEEGVTIDAKKVRIEKDVCVRAGAIIKGEISASIADDFPDGKKHWNVRIFGIKGRKR